MKLVEVLLTARSVSQEYNANHQYDCPIRIFENGLKEIVEKQVGQKLSIKCLPWSGAMFAARLDRYVDESKIWYSEQLNSCWSRFYIAKELAHVLCGDQSNFTKDPLVLIESIINDNLPLTEDMEDCKLEYQAFYGAVELLIPEHLYDHLYTLADSKSNRELAAEFRVPEKIIDFRLSSSGRKIFDQFNAEV